MDITVHNIKAFIEGVPVNVVGGGTNTFFG